MDFRFDPNDLQRLNRLAFLPRLTSGDPESGGRRSRRAGDGTDFFDYRQYVPGDDLRKVDWHVYGRLRQLFTRLHESQRQVGVSFLIDASRSMTFGAPMTKLEQAQRLVCALGFTAMRGGDRVYCYGFSDSTGAGVGPLTGSRGLARLVQYLRSVQPGKMSDLTSAVRRARAEHRDRGAVVVVSDFLNVPDRDRALASAQAAGAQVVVVQVVDPIDRGEGLIGTVRLRDSETGKMVDIELTPRTRERFQAAFEEERARFERHCKGRGWHYLLADTHDHYLQVVCDALRVMAVRR